MKRFCGHCAMPEFENPREGPGLSEGRLRYIYNFILLLFFSVQCSKLKSVGLKRSQCMKEEEREINDLRVNDIE